MSFDSFSLPAGLAWVEIPDTIGAQLWNAAIVKGEKQKDAEGAEICVYFAKAGAPKYIRRWRKANGKYAYAYASPVGAIGAHHFNNPEHFHAGASFAHGNGHYEVHDKDEHGNLTLTHSDDPTKQIKMHADQFAAHLKEHHAAAIDKHRSKLLADLGEAHLHGNGKQVERLSKEAAKHGYGLPEGAHSKVEAAAAKLKGTDKLEAKKEDNYDFSGGAPGPGKEAKAPEQKPATFPQSRIEHSLDSSNLERVSWDPEKPGSAKGTMKVHFKGGDAGEHPNVHHDDYMKVVNAHGSHGKAYNEHIKGLHDYVAKRTATPEDKKETSARGSETRAMNNDRQQKAAAEFMAQKEGKPSPSKVEETAAKLKEAKPAEAKTEPAKPEPSKVEQAAAKLKESAGLTPNRFEKLDPKKFDANGNPRVPKGEAKAEAPATAPAKTPEPAPAKQPEPAKEAAAPTAATPSASDILSHAKATYGLNDKEHALVEKKAHDLGKHLAAGDTEKANAHVKQSVESVLAGMRNMSPSSARRHMKEAEAKAAPKAPKAEKKAKDEPAPAKKDAAKVDHKALYDAAVKRGDEDSAKAHAESAAMAGDVSLKEDHKKRGIVRGAREDFKHAMDRGLHDVAERHANALSEAGDPSARQELDNERKRIATTPNNTWDEKVKATKARAEALRERAKGVKSIMARGDAEDLIGDASAHHTHEDIAKIHADMDKAEKLINEHTEKTEAPAKAEAPAKTDAQKKAEHYAEKARFQKEMDRRIKENMTKPDDGSDPFAGIEGADKPAPYGTSQRVSEAFPEAPKKEASKVEQAAEKIKAEAPKAEAKPHADVANESDRSKLREMSVSQSKIINDPSSSRDAVNSAREKWEAVQDRIEHLTKQEHEEQHKRDMAESEARQADYNAKYTARRDAIEAMGDPAFRRAMKFAHKTKTRWDKARPELQGVYVKDGVGYASDGHRAIAFPAKGAKDGFVHEHGPSDAGDPAHGAKLEKLMAIPEHGHESSHPVKDVREWTKTGAHVKLGSDKHNAPMVPSEQLKQAIEAAPGKVRIITNGTTQPVHIIRSDGERHIIMPVDPKTLNKAYTHDQIAAVDDWLAKLTS